MLQINLNFHKNSYFYLLCILEIKLFLNYALLINLRNHLILKIV